MKFIPSLIKVTLHKRYKRFLADVSHPDLGEFTVHCPNTGSMKNCWQPNWNIWLEKSDNKKRKYPYTWVLAENELGEMIGINTHLANKLAVEAIENKKIKEIKSVENVQTEVKYGLENSRIDILINHIDQSKTFIEVKSVTLKSDEKGVTKGYFPDAKTVRGQKHIRELMECVKSGDKAILLYVVQHSGISSVEIAREIDPEYGSLLEQAVENGVMVLAYQCKINESEIVLEHSIPFIL
ncbi:MAG: DNA/RNA nuclease SfsA [Kangiellaceae bacterium]